MGSACAGRCFLGEDCKSRFMEFQVAGIVNEDEAKCFESLAVLQNSSYPGRECERFPREEFFVSE